MKSTIGMAAVAATMMAASAAHAALAFELDPNQVYSTAAGQGQKISVASDTNLTAIAFSLDSGASGHVKFMIWDGALSSLLYSQTDDLPSAVSPVWVKSDPFSFKLDAGKSYYIAFYTDVFVNFGNVGYPDAPYTSNGLTAPADLHAAFFGTYSSPAPSCCYSGQIALQLFDDKSGGVPEPATWALMIGGFGLAGAALRRRAKPALAAV